MLATPQVPLGATSQAPSPCGARAGAMASLARAAYVPRGGPSLPHLPLKRFCSPRVALGRAKGIPSQCPVPSLPLPGEALMGGKPSLCLRLRWDLAGGQLPPPQPLLAPSNRGVWAFDPLQKGQVEPKQKADKAASLVRRSTQVPGLEGTTPR